MTGDQAVVEDEAGIRHAGKRASGYAYGVETGLRAMEYSIGLKAIEYLIGETACGIPYAWHSSRTRPRMHYVDPEDRFPTCLWCASCP